MPERARSRCPTSRSRCCSRPTSSTRACCSVTSPIPRAALGDVGAVAAARAAGSLVCEEPVRYRSDDPSFAAYEEIVTAVVAATGATLWAATALDDDPPGCERVLDRVVEHPVPAARAAGDVLAQRGAVAAIARPTRGRADRATSGARTAEARRDRDVGAASGRVQEAPRVMPAFFRTSGGTPNSRHAP